MLPAIPPLASPLATLRADDPALTQVAREFEAMVLSEMLRPMFEGLSTDGLGGGGMGEEMFRPMLVEQYANAIARQGGLGFAQTVLTELVRLQGATAQQEPSDGADR